MKNTINIFIYFTICLLALQLNAQEGYTYTLIDNGSFNYTVEAVPNASTSNFATSVQSYGFTIILPDGITASFSSSLGGAADNTPFDGSAVGDSSIDGYLITETLGSPMALPAPSAATNSAMINIQVNGSPTSGNIAILANDSALAMAVAPLQSFMSADMIDNGMAIFTNVVTTNASGLSGTESHEFSTLSIEDNRILEFSIFPNPIDSSNAVMNFNWPSNNALIDLTVIDVNGRIVQTHKAIEIQSGLNTIGLSQIDSGLYFAQMTFEQDKRIITKKIIIK